MVLLASASLRACRFESHIKEKTTPVKLLYDTWMEADVRTPAGEIVDLPISKAKELIQQGKAIRADKFPGE